jgi:hypothetical protein
VVQLHFFGWLCLGAFGVSVICWVKLNMYEKKLISFIIIIAGIDYNFYEFDDMMYCKVEHSPYIRNVICLPRMFCVPTYLVGQL